MSSHVVKFVKYVYNINMEVSGKTEAYSTEKFQRFAAASTELGSQISGKLEVAGVEKRYALNASVFCLAEEMALDSDASLDQVLKRAREIGSEVVVYTGGINWRGGENIHETEKMASGSQLKRKGLLAMSQDISQEFSSELSMPGVKRKETGASALNFFADAGKTVVITINPILVENQLTASFLRADAIAKKTTAEVIRQAGAEQKSINWSDGGFKDIQIQFAGYCAIVDDLRSARESGLLGVELTRKFLEAEKDPKDVLSTLSHILLQVRISKENERSLSNPGVKMTGLKQHLRQPVFLSGYEALQYFESFAGVDNIKAAAPAKSTELAHPFNSTHPNPVAKDVLRPLANYLVELVGKNEAHPLLDAILYNKLPTKSIAQAGDTLVVFRLLELGRGITGKEGIDVAESSCQLAQALVRAATRRAVDVSFGDTSGNVVNAASKDIGTPILSRLIHGNDALYIETRDNPAAPSIHIEVKRAIGEIERLVAAQKLGLITDSPDSGEVNHRYIPVMLSVSELHPNGSTLHHPRRLDRDKFKQLRQSSVKEQRALIDLCAPLFEVETG